jgi:hypothetical protein
MKQRDRRRRRRRRLDQGCRGMGLLDDDGSCVLLLLQEHGGGKDPSAGSVVPFLRVGGSGDHGVEFLPELNGLDSLVVVVGGHRSWWHGTQGGGTAHRRCSRRREGARPLGFEKSGSEKKNLNSDYHVGERRDAEYWIALY